MREGLTETKAQLKWCPFARVGYGRITEGGGTGFAYNRDKEGDPPNTCLCLAGACMAWRWETFEPQGHPHRKGYCGLAD